MARQGSRIAGEQTPAGVGEASDAVIVAVIELLETEGYEAVQLREVARRARVSMTTIYRRYPTREALIVGALRWWMERTGTPVSQPAPLNSCQVRCTTTLWRCSALFSSLGSKIRACSAAYFRAQAGPGGRD